VRTAGAVAGLQGQKIRSRGKRKVDPKRMKTSQLVAQLKDAGQDEEFYPTTEAMITAVLRYIPKDAKALIDIGAGDGRVLKRFSEKCESAKLYGIEKSAILSNAQPENIIPVGTDLFEQQLASLPADYIFCNPPYSEYEEWVCKIISEGYAKKAFLVIPQRWKDSKLIQQSLKLRGASARAIYHDDFLDAERPARAIIDIVEISFPREYYGQDKSKDPFDIWFDQNIDTFDKAEEPDEDDAGKDLARKYAHASIDEIVAAYKEEYTRLEENYRAIFKLDYEILRELGVNKNNVRDGLKLKLSNLKIKYWHILFDRLDAITSRLSTRSKEKLIGKLTANASVEFTVGNAYAVVIWAIKNANQYFDEQLTDLFFDLSSFEGAMKYKSNIRTWSRDDWRYRSREERHTHYSLDYRIVVSKYTALRHDDWQYPGNLYKDCHDLIADVIAVMSNLGFSTNSEKSKEREWFAGKWQDFHMSNSEDILFQVKAYWNGNLHFRFAPEAIKALNVAAGRLLKWIRTEEDVVLELGYTAEEAKMYFAGNSYILPSGVKLLGQSQE
jgi:hypothetical protein